MANEEPSSGVEAGVEEAMLGRGRRWYRWVVRAVVGFLVTMIVVDVVWIATDALGLSVFSPPMVDGLWTLTAVALTLFLLTGLVQFVVIGRVFERNTAAVAESAEQLEATATEVEAAAADVEAAASDVEAAATDVEGAAADSQTADAATATEETTEAVKDQTTGIRDQTTEIKGEMADAERTAGEIRDEMDAKQPESQQPDDPNDPDDRGYGSER